MDEYRQEVRAGDGRRRHGADAGARRDGRSCVRVGEARDEGEGQEEEGGQEMRETIAPSPLFDLGQVVATPDALRELAAIGWTPLPYVARHVRGDWGELCRDD